MIPSPFIACNRGSSLFIQSDCESSQPTGATVLLVQVLAVVGSCRMPFKLDLFSLGSLVMNIDRYKTTMRFLLRKH